MKELLLLRGVVSWALREKEGLGVTLMLAVDVGVVAPGVNRLLSASLRGRRSITIELGVQ